MNDNPGIYSAHRLADGILSSLRKVIGSIGNPTINDIDVLDSRIFQVLKDHGMTLNWDNEEAFYIEYPFNFPGMYAVSDDDLKDPTVINLTRVRWYY